MAQTQAETGQQAGKKAGRVEHHSVAERVEIGKAARKQAPRAVHAEFEPSPGRPDPIALLESQAETRVPELVPIRYGRMMVSPFAFYRGAALIMASDLARTPVSGIRAQLCGDAHLSNFGVFASAERSLVFDLNDFDETLRGPWEWDVKRLAASLAVAGRENGYTRKERKGIVREMVAGYRTAMQQFAGMPNLAVWYARLDIEPRLAALRDHSSRRPSSGRSDAGQGAHQGQYERVLQADPRGRRRAADHQRPAADRARPRARPRRPRRRDHRGRDGLHPRLPAHAAERPPDPPGTVPVCRHRAQGGRRRQRRHTRLDRAADGAATGRIRYSCR